MKRWLPLLLALFALAALGCGQAKKSPAKDAAATSPIADAEAISTAPATTTGGIGPRITTEDAWTRCQLADDCTRIYSPCGTHNVVINKASAPQAVAAFQTACQGKVGVGVVGAPSTYECHEGRCRVAAPQAGTTSKTSKVLGLPVPDPAAPAETGPRVVLGKPTVVGGVDLPVARRLVRRAVPAIRDCYAKRLARSPGIKGTLTVALEVEKQGRVTRLAITGVKDRALVACVKPVIKAIRFPASSAPTTVEAPLDLIP